MNCAACPIEHRAGVGRRRVAAPCYMSVRAYQHEAPLVERGDRRVLDVDDLERDVARLGFFREFFSRRPEAQQSEAVAKEIERRASVPQPCVRSPGARMT